MYSHTHTDNKCPYAHKHAGCLLRLCILDGSITCLIWQVMGPWGKCMHGLNSVATNWQMLEGTLVSDDRVYDSQEFNRVLKSKTSFQHALPMVDYHSAPTRIHRRWNIQSLWGRAGCPQVIDSPNTQVCAPQPPTSIRAQVLLKPMALKHMPACSAGTKADTDLDTSTQTS